VSMVVVYVPTIGRDAQYKIFSDFII
jgi:hypothetical protein